MNSNETAVLRRWGRETGKYDIKQTDQGQATTITKIAKLTFVFSVTQIL